MDYALRARNVAGDYPRGPLELHPQRLWIKLVDGCVEPST